MTEIARGPHAAGRQTPPYDERVVGKVAKAIQISDVVLTDLHFVRKDDGPLPEPIPEDLAPQEVGIAVNGWRLQEGVLGCLLSFRTFFDDGAESDPYVIMATFRIVYDVTTPPEEGFSEHEIDAFVHWNAVFNAWPYWRELLTSVMNRGQLPRYLVPVLMLPRSTSD